VRKMKRDIVVIGCSAGGVEALPRVLQQLPEDLQAALFIVQHMAPTSDRYLVNILTRACRLPVAWAEQGARIQRGCVIVAPPDLHLMFTDDHISLTRGARENHARPSIDKLFRSAAAVHGSRAIGVLLTGMLDDGVAGLRAIRDAGGLVIIQDPAGAAFPELPMRALIALAPDRTLLLDEIGTSITKLVGEPVDTGTVPQNLALEAAIDHAGVSSPDQMTALGPQTSMTCPECHGPMWQIGDDQMRRYRCYLGHSAPARELLAARSAEVEAALWSAIRALNDRATTFETLAKDAVRTGNGHSAAVYETRGRQAREQAELARQFMLDVSGQK
ncbi:MAG: chemotaxis protein CheB, partial [Solirubrobacteraceae bacterium]